MTYQRKPHQTAIGPLSARSSTAQHFVAPRVDFDKPERITSFSKGGTYSQKADWANSAMRPGCMDAFSLPSVSPFKTSSDRLIEPQESRAVESASADSAVVLL